MATKKYPDDLIKKGIELAQKTSARNAAKEIGVPYSTFNYYYNKALKKEKDKTSKIIKPIKPAEEVKNVQNVTFQPAEKVKYRRGDIYYVHKMTTTGSEMLAGRPAIIISNDRLNEKLDAVEVVFMTTKPKCLAPEHLTIKASGATATVICEQITTVDKCKLGNFVGTCSPDEIKLLEKALMHSLDLEKYTKTTISDDQIVQRIAAIKAERDAYKQIYDELFNRMMNAKK